MPCLPRALAPCPPFGLLCKCFLFLGWFLFFGARCGFGLCVVAGLSNCNGREAVRFAPLSDGWFLICFCVGGGCRGAVGLVRLSGWLRACACFFLRGVGFALPPLRGGASPLRVFYSSVCCWACSLFGFSP